MSIEPTINHSTRCCDTLSEEIGRKKQNKMVFRSDEEAKMYDYIIPDMWDMDMSTQTKIVTPNQIEASRMQKHACGYIIHSRRTDSDKETNTEMAGVDGVEDDSTTCSNESVVFDFGNEVLGHKHEKKHIGVSSIDETISNMTKPEKIHIYSRRLRRSHLIPRKHSRIYTIITCYY